MKGLVSKRKTTPGRVRFFRLTAACLAVLPLLASCRKPTGTEPTLAGIAQDFGMALEGGHDYFVRKNLLRERGGRGYWTVEASSAGRVIKVEAVRGVDEDAARAFMEEGKYVLGSLFQATPSPYPGVISRDVTVPREFAPRTATVVIGGESVEVFLLPSTARFTYGVKVEDNIEFRGGILFFHDRGAGTVFRVDLFVPKEEYSEAEVLRIFGSLEFRGQGPASVAVSGSGASRGGESDGPVGDASAPPAAEPGSGTWNLIVVGFEPLGARHVGVYGYAKRTTPNLDRFAEDAVLFRNAVSTSSWTLPAFMSWFTSLYPSQHSLTNKYRLSTMVEGEDPQLSRLPEGITTLAEHLKRNGFATAGFTGGAALSRDFGYGRGFDTYFDEVTFGGFDTTMPRAIQWLRENRDRRFFLFVQGFDVHGRFPLREGAERSFYDGSYSGRYKGTVEEYWDLRDANLDDPEFELNARDVAFWTAHYDAKIFEADRRFGNFMEEVARLGLLDNSVIVVSSGSGNEYFEHGGLDHGLTLYDELVLVPLVIRVPGLGGRVVEEQARTLDIMPTVLDLLRVDPGKEISSQMEGVSLFQGPGERVSAVDAYMETDYLAQSFKRAVRTHDGYKLIYSMENAWREVYNLKEDPGETRNLFEEQKPLSSRLEQMLFSHMERIKAGSR
ncbi:MAG: sulfatase [bacterium]|nr:MAG: sulfatase [bacterium]